MRGRPGNGHIVTWRFYVGVEVIFSGDSILSEKKILTSDSIDEERNMIIKGIELENNFYNLFRNTLRIIINYKIKTKDKMSLLSLLNNSFISFTS